MALRARRLICRPRNAVLTGAEISFEVSTSIDWNDNRRALNAIHHLRDHAAGAAVRHNETRTADFSTRRIPIERSATRGCIANDYIARDMNTPLFARIVDLALITAYISFTNNGPARSDDTYVRCSEGNVP